MPSFDTVCEPNLVELKNAIEQANKEITNRFDFKGIHVVIDLNKKDYMIKLESDSEMKLQQIVDVLLSRSIKQGIDANAFDLSKTPQPSGKIFKLDVPVRNGLKQEDAKKISKYIKDKGLKVQTAIMDDIIRCTGKKIDDLQEVIAACRTENFGVPLQYINMKS